MRKSWLLCVLLGTFAWGQAAPAEHPPTPAPAPSAMPNRPAPPPDLSAEVPPNAAVITVEGVCSTPPRAAAAKGTAAKPASETKSAVTKTPAADCKTVITKAEFEKLASGIAPNMTPQLKRQLASVLPRLIAMSAAAKKKGLEKTSQYEETLKFAKMQILTQELQRRIQEDAAKVSDTEIDSYYKQNPEAFEQFNLDRLFVPRTKQPEPESKEQEEADEKLTPDQRKAKEDEERAKSEASEQDMSKLADSLRAEAVAGDDFVKLQKEAFESAGMKIESPTVNLPKVRRTGLPPAHAAVFNLKAGDVSQIISDTGGHYIYKVVSEEELPLDQVKEEIHNKLQNENARKMVEAINSSFHAVPNEKYFGAATPGAMTGPPPRRMPPPRMAPSPTTPQGSGGPTHTSQPAAQTPAAPEQAPPPAQPQAAKPN
jgi:hypothetical protein